jgi:hypothetical protein
MLVNVYSKIGSTRLTKIYRPSPSRVCCIFVQLTNNNVSGKLPIRDSNNRVNWKLLLVDLAKIQYARDGEGPDL